MGFFRSNEEKILQAIVEDNAEKIKSVIKKANKKYKIININEKDKNNHSLIYLATFRNNTEIVRLIIDYADSHKFLLKLNEKDGDGLYPLLRASFNNNIEIIQILMEYADNNNIILNVNDKTKYGEYPIYCATYKNSLDLVKILMEYCSKHNIRMELNEKNKYEYFPLYWATYNNNNEMVKLLIEYSTYNDIILNVDEKNKNGNYPLLWATSNNNFEMVKMLIDYATAFDISMDLNKKNKKGNYPLLWATSNNNIDIVKLLFDYANNRQIPLEFSEDDIKDISKINPEIINMWRSYEKVEVKEKAKEKEIQEIQKAERLIREKVEEREKRRRSERLEKERRIRAERLEKQKQEILEKEEKEKFEKLEKEKNEEIEREEWERMEKIEIVNRNNTREMKVRQSRKNPLQPNIPTLVIALDDYRTNEENQLDIRKDELLMVLKWDCDKGWVYGYRKENENEKGYFPKDFIKVYKDKNKAMNILKSEVSPDYKVKKFEKKIKKLRSLKEMRIIDEGTEISLHRNNIFNDAFNIIMNKSRRELRERIIIKYIGEQGTDAGGLLREFLYEISKEIGDPKFLLFRYPHENSYELEVNPKFGAVDPVDLQYYRFIGRIIALAIIHKEYLSITFTTLFCKKLLNKPLEFSDLEDVDPELYRNLKQLETINGVENLYLTFSIDLEDGFGNMKNVELIPNGANIDVTDANKKQYIDLMVKYKLRNTYDTKQLTAIKKGFYEIIPRSIASVLDGIDLKYLISGINKIDVDDWESNTDYEDFKKKDITIINFWKCVREFDNEDRKKLLLFATGNSQVPVTGFKDLQGNGSTQRFNIKKIGTSTVLPQSHTCFNRIDLPPYTSYTEMKQKLLLAITEGTGCFSMD